VLCLWSVRAATTAPVTATICATKPVTAACEAPPAASVAGDFVPDKDLTFSIFLSASAPITLDPANSRVEVTFTDSSGNLLARTSVAVDTD
jgi:hypothetical protein